MMNLRRKQAVPLVFEELEPRILYSADTAALVDPDALATAAEVRSMDAYMAPANEPAASANAPVSEGSREIAFVDTRVQDHERVVDELANRDGEERELEVVLLDASRDGVEQIGEVLAGRRDLDAVHIVSHGTPGVVMLGDGILDARSLLERANEIGAWGESLSADADILVYGCDVANGDGAALIDALARLTGADVAASTDATGAAALGGDWALEYSTGAVETAVAFDPQLQHDWLHLMANESLLDNFTASSYGNSDGTQAWASNWIETDSGGGGPSAGNLEVTGGQLRLDPMSVGNNVHREANLAGATSATLSYFFDNTAFGGLTRIDAEISGDGGANYTLLKTYDAFTQTSGTDTFDISSYIASNTRVRFFIVNTNNNDYLYIDDFRIDYVTNAAPVLDAARSPALGAVNEDAGAPSGAVGTLVSSLVDFAVPAGQVDNVSDADAGAQLGIAVTAADAANGTWYYSTNNGGAWNALGAVGNNNARLLAADAGTRLYFQPNANYNGTVASGITFRAWDRTSGANGALADTTANGGTTAFSAATDTASLTVNAVNDAPTVTSAALTLNEGQTVTLAPANFAITDVDNAAFTYTVSGVTGGYFQLSGAPGTPITTFSSAQLAGGVVQFVDDGDEVVPAFSVKVNDGTVDSNTLAATVTYTAVNDAPAVTSASMIVTRGATVTLTEADIVVADPDHAAFTFTVSGVTGGYFQLSSAPGTPIATFTTAQLEGGLVQFIDDGDAVAPAFSVRANDGTVNSNTLAASVTFYVVNAAPVLDNTKTPALTAQNEDAGAPMGAVGTLVSSLVDFAVPAGQVDNVTDADAGALLGIAVTAADTTNGTWHYSINNGASWNALGAVANNNARLLAADGATRLYFQPNAGYHGMIANAVTFHAWDRSTGANGGTADLASASYTVRDNFGAASYGNNDGTANWSTNWAESMDDLNPASGQLRITGGELRFNNDDGGTLEAIKRGVDLSAATSATLSFDYRTNGSVTVGDSLSVQISSDGGANWTTLETFTGISGATSGSRSYDVSVHATASSQIRFAINGGFNGGSDFFYVDNVEVAYTTGGTGGITPFSATVDSASLVINAVADTPSVTNATTNEEAQTTSGLVISRNGADGAEVTHFKITGITNGTLYKNDGVTQISDGAFITFAEGNAGLKFTPALNFNGSGSFIVQASTSNADAGLGGSTASATITANAVNDAPALANGTLAAVNEDTANPAGEAMSTIFSGQFSDVDTGATFSGIAVVGNTATAATEGTWQYSSNGGTNWFAIGAVSDDATALAVSSASRIRFVPAADYNGAPPALVVRGLDNTYAGGFSTTAGAETRVTVDSAVNGGSTAIAGSTANLSTTINAVNDAPVVASAAMTVTRGETVALSDANFSVTDPDNAAFTYTVSGVTGGYFQLASAPGTQVTTFTSADLSGNLVQFVDDGDTAAPAFSVAVNDGAANSNTLAATVTFNLVNSAPVLDNTRTPALTAVNEDGGAPVGAVGTLVSSLVDFAAPAGQVDNVTDSDAGAVLGIAVTGADTTNGTWFYSTNGGAAWNPLGAVSDTNARLLAADANTRLYFQPNANWQGTLANAITFRAWDRTSGVAGTTADVTVTTTFRDAFNSVSYSNNNGTANWSTGWIETEKFGGNNPSGGNVRVTGGELRMTPDTDISTIRRIANLTGATSATLTFDYNNVLAAGDEIAVAASSDGWATFTVLPGIVFNNTTNTGAGSMSIDVSAYISANTGIAFGQTSNGAGGFLYLDNVQITAVKTGGGTSAFSSSTDTASLAVNAVADTPSVTSAMTNEDTQSSSGLVISRNAADAAEVTHFKVTGITNGTLYKNDGVTQITDGTFITFAEGNAGLKFTPALNFNGSGSFTVQASTSAADAGLGGATANATITVNPIADTPSVTNATTNEDIQSSGGLVILRNAADGAEVTHFKVTGITNGTLYKNDGVTQIANGTFITFAEGNAGLKFTPTSNFSGGGSFTIQASTSNADAGLGGGTASATITVNTTADTPSVTNATTNEDTQSVAGLVISRNAVDGAEVTHFKVTGITNGTLYRNDGVTQVANGTFITFAEGNAGLKFTPDPDFNGSGSFTVQASTSNADAGLAGGTATATITVNAVNDAPVVTGATLTVSEGQTVTLTGANFTVTDPDNVAFTYTVSAVTGGYFQLSSAAGTPVTSFTSAQLTGGLLQFVDDGDEIAPAFSVTVNDGAASSNTLAATITYNPVNDAPAVTSAALSVNEGQTVTLTAANFGVTDPDNAAFTYTASGVTGGYFQLSSAAGTPVTSFTSAQLTGGLVQFVDDGNEAGPAFDVTVSDGAASSNTLAATITYNPVNDTPVVTSAALSVNEGQTVTLAAANFGVTDPDNAAFTYTASGVTGGYFQLSSAAGTPITSFSSAQLAGGLVQFVDDGNEAAPAFDVTVSDGAASSNTLAATITYNPVNDTPVVTSAALSVNEGQTATLTAANFGVTDPDNAAFTYTASAVTGGYFQLSSAAGTPITSFSSAQLAGGLVQFVDDGDEVAPAFSVTVSDGAASSNTLAATVTYNPVNDAPVVTSASMALSEGQTLTLSVGDVGITDPDSAVFTYTVTGVTGGYFQLTTAPGTPTTTFTGADLAANRVQFVDDGNEVAPAFSITVSDGAATSNTRAATITYTPVNDAPVLNSARNPVLGTQTEDSPAPSGPVGTRVSSLVDFAAPAGQVDNVTDAEAGALLGIAITSASTANGTWFYSTDDGATWNALGAVADNSARLLAADAGTRVYFQPNANYHGTQAGALTFRAWDRTSGAAGALADATANGGSTAFSSATDTIALTVSPTADTPTVTAAVTNEDTQTASGLVIARNAADGAEVTHFRITNIANGTLYHSNGVTPISSGAFITAAQGMAGLKFTPAVNFNGNASFDVQASRSGAMAGLGGGIATATIVISAVNDAPFAADENGAPAFDGVNGYVAVPGSPSLVMTSTMTFEAWINPATAIHDNMIIVNKEGEYEVALLPTGELQWAFANTNPGWAWHRTGHFAAFDQSSHIAVTYDNGIVNTYVNGNLVDTFNGAGTIGDVHPGFDELRIGTRSLSTAPQHFHGQLDDVRIWNVARTQGEIAANFAQQLAGNEAGLVGLWRFDETAGNTAADSSQYGNHGTYAGGAGAPVRVGPFVTSEDTTLTVASASGVLANDTDVENDPLTAVLVAGPAHGTLTLMGDGSFTYTPHANYHGTDSFSYKASDGALDSAVATVTINVAAIDDAPTGAHASVTTGSSSVYSFRTADFGFSDAADAGGATGAHALAAVQVSTLPGSGALRLDGVAVVAGQLVAAADIAAGKLVYTGPNAAMTASATSFTFRVQDTGGTAGGGKNLDAAAKTMTLTVPAARPVVVVTQPVEPVVTATPTEAAVAANTQEQQQSRTTRAPKAPAAPVVAAAPSADAASAAAGSLQLESIVSVGDARIASSAAPAPRKLAPLSPPVNPLVAEALDIALKAQQPVLPDLLGVPAGARFEASSSMPAGDTESADKGRALVTFESTMKLTGTALTAGVVAWALRGAGLLTSLLASIPAWRFLDPVPVLAPDDEKDEWNDLGDDESAREEQAVSNLLRAAGPTGTNRSI